MSTKEEALAQITARIEEDYHKRTRRSRMIAEEAGKYMPGGDTRRSIFFFPYPVWVDTADGCRLRDVDGNEYIDFHNCYTVMMLGHGNPGIKAAIKGQLDQGTTALGAFKEIVVQWAKMLCARLESLDQVRFTNTGSEAVMMAIRAARGWTGKDKVIMEYAGYHGCYDAVVFPPDANGLPKSLMQDTIIVPYNDKEALEKAILENEGQVAALVLEGLMGSAGMIPAKDDYLRFASKVSAEHNIVFILDEIISFRLDYGGLQRLEGIKPDLTTLGKTMAGGTPGAAFGGRRDIMQQFAPQTQRLHHAGTLNANPVTAAAGVAALEQMTPELIARINMLGDSLMNGIRGVFREAGIKGQVTGKGSLCNLHFGPEPVVDGYTARDTTNRHILHLFHLLLTNRGILTPERGMFCISAPMSEREISAAIGAVEDSVHELKPYIEQIWPELMGTI